MKLRLLLLCRGLPLAVAFLLATAPAPAAQPLPSSRYVEGELLVKFQGGPRGDSAAQARQTFKHEVKRRFDRVGWQHIQLQRFRKVQCRQGVSQQCPEGWGKFRFPSRFFLLAKEAPNGYPSHYYG